MSYITEKGVTLTLEGSGTESDILLATDLIFSNAVRDSSGLVDSDDFPDSMKYNKVSEKINEIVMSQVIVSFRGKVKKGSILKFTGASEVFEDNPQISPLRVIPIHVEIE